jgi:hypothetical protein
VTEHSTARLARALSQIPGVPPAMIRRAVDGYYHDYLSPLALPEIALVSDLRSLAAQPTTGPNARAQLEDLARCVIRGDFDATREESDAWAASPEGRALFAELGIDPESWGR